MDLPSTSRRPKKWRCQKTIAEDGDVFDFGFVATVLWAEGATEERRDTKEFESVRREELLVNGFGDALFGQRDAVAVVEDHVLDGFGVGLHLKVLGQGVADAVVVVFLR